MLPLLMGSLASAVIAKIVSEYLSDGIESSYQEKRFHIKERANFEIKKYEYQSREILLDMLSDAQKDAWEEINLIRENYPKIIKQIDFALKHSKYHKDFSSKKVNADFRISISTYKEILKAREFYWHTLVKKYSTKKYEISNSSLNHKKILYKDFFNIPDPEEFVQIIPRKGFFCKSYVDSISSKSIRLLCNVPINYGNKPFRSNLSLDHYPPSTSKWSVGNTYETFVTSVNYYERRYTISIPLTNLIKSILKNEYVFSGNPIPIKKDERLVGYELTSRGNNFFLPHSLAGSKSKRNELIEVTLVKENLDPFNLIVKII